MNEKQIKEKLGQTVTLQALMTTMLNEGLTKEDFVQSFENVVKYVKKIEDKTATDLEAVKDSLTALAERIRADTSNDVVALRKDALDLVSVAITNMMNDYAERVEKWTARLDIVRDGKDADEEVIVGKVLAKIPPAPVPAAPYNDEEIREDIDELREELKKALEQGKQVNVVNSPSRGMFIYIGGVKKGIISNMNLVAGTNMAIAYSQVNGQDTLTFNASGGGPGGLTVETPPEAPNAVITTFTVSAEPQWVVADGTTYFDGQGYTYAALQVTMDIPPSATIRVII